LFINKGTHMRTVAVAALLWALGAVLGLAQERRPIVDAHIHYSHDTWDVLPPAEAVKVLREAGLRKAFVSSSSDDGTQMLLKAAPDLIVPVLRPYRRRGEIGTWVRDPSIVRHMEARLAANTYAGIGEFHVFGADADLPVMRRLVELARERKIFLHAHSDADAVERIFAQDPEARVLWAHSGFTYPDAVRAMLARHRWLWADLAYRNDYAPYGHLDATWRQLFLDFPDRFMVGTDTPSPERWYYVVEHARLSRAWLAELPTEVADNIAFRNAERLAAWALRERPGERPGERPKERPGQ
jgi:predicted TIM-barrel fold metal-dependent hydrolase